MYTLEQMPDLEEIKVLKHRYFRLMDTGQWEDLRHLFTKDIHVDFRGGTYRVRLDGCEDMIEFLSNSFHSGAATMHHGHMPEITITDRDSAEGVWYLDDITIHLEDNIQTFGGAIYRDQYRRVDGAWKIARTEYDRVIEVKTLLPADLKVSFHHLAKVGRKPHERSDVSRFITWTEKLSD